jgi:hypothetical protein
MVGSLAGTQPTAGSSARFPALQEEPELVIGDIREFFRKR